MYRNILELNIGLELQVQYIKWNLTNQTDFGNKNIMKFTINSFKVSAEYPII